MNQTNRFLTFLTLVLLGSLSTFLCNAQSRFEGSVVVEWIDGGLLERDMLLIKDFTFVGPNGKKWIAPAGAKINGASIPSIFWSYVGSPFVGNYRRASVVHDYYCDVRTESWMDVHRMFYDAMIAGGVPVLEAKVLYGFVYAGGPRWKSHKITSLEGSEEIITSPISFIIDKDLQSTTPKWIRSTNPTLEEIETHLDSGTTIK